MLEEYIDQQTLIENYRRVLQSGASKAKLSRNALWQGKCTAP